MAQGEGSNPPQVNEKKDQMMEVRALQEKGKRANDDDIGTARSSTATGTRKKGAGDSSGIRIP